MDGTRITTETDDLTPWVDTLEHGVDDHLRALLGLSDRVELSHRPRERRASDRLGDLVVGLRLPDGRKVELDVGEAEETGRAWFTAHGLSFGYRKLADGSDPLEDPALARSLTTLLDRFAARPKASVEAPLEALITALEHNERFEQVQDFMFRQISAGARGKHGSLRLGFRCNQDCGFCWQGRDWPEPPPEVLFGWLDEMADAGIGHLTVSGGEPTLFRALPELIERATTVHGMWVELQTNAIRLRKEAYIGKLVRAGLRAVFVSYHSADPAVSDRMTRAPGTHGATVAGIDACLRHGLEVELNCVVERANFARLGDHARTIVERFVRPFPDTPVRRVAYSDPCSSYDAARWADASVPLDEVEPHLVAAVRTLRDAGVEVDVVGPSCGFPPCVMRRDPGFIRWPEPAAFDTMDTSGRFHAAACEGCAVRATCLGVRREYLDMHGDRGIVPFSEHPGAGSGAARPRHREP